VHGLGQGRLLRGPLLSRSRRQVHLLVPAEQFAHRAEEMGALNVSNQGSGFVMHGRELKVESVS
jgi:hypothetical protein